MTLCGASECPIFSATISAENLPPGRKRLRFSATDIRGNKGETVRDVLFDPGPKVEVLEPEYESVTRQKIKIRARCMDDQTDSCVLSASFSIAREGTPIEDIECKGSSIPLGTAAVSTELDLSNFSGSSVLMCVLARDSGGYVATEKRVVHVVRLEMDSSVKLLGKVLSVTDQRVMSFIASSSANTSSGGNGRLVFQSWSGEVLDEIPVPSNIGSITAGYLMPDAGAALWSSQSQFLGYYDGKTIRSIGVAPSFFAISVAGTFILWSDARDSRRLLLFDARTDTTREISKCATSQWNQVNKNGHVIFAEGDASASNGCRFLMWEKIYRDIDGDKKFIAGGVGFSYRYPVAADGKRIIAQKWEASSKVFSAVLIDGEKEEVLIPPDSRQPLPGPDYTAAGGWIALRRRGPGGVHQVWRGKNPQKLTQVSEFGLPSLVLSLSVSGAVIFSNQAGRYLAPTTGLVTALGKMPGAIVAVTDGFVALIGSHIFKIPDAR
jgi:hypothetical protein